MITERNLNLLFYLLSISEHHVTLNNLKVISRIKQILYENLNLNNYNRVYKNTVLLYFVRPHTHIHGESSTYKYFAFTKNIFNKCTEDNDDICKYTAYSTYHQ